jgi:hypothetical protein
MLLSARGPRHAALSFQLPPVSRAFTTITIRLPPLPLLG